MNKNEFISEMNRLQNCYSKKLDSDTYKLYWEEFKNYNHERFKETVDHIITHNKFFPTIAEIVTNITELGGIKDYNLNSSYWYENLREHCEEAGIPYYDITKGVNFPLPPFKN